MAIRNNDSSKMHLLYSAISYENGPSPSPPLLFFVKIPVTIFYTQSNINFLNFRQYFFATINIRVLKIKKSSKTKTYLYKKR